METGLGDSESSLNKAVELLNSIDDNISVINGNIKDYRNKLDHFTEDDYNLLIAGGYHSQNHLQNLLDIHCCLPFLLAEFSSKMSSVDGVDISTITQKYKSVSAAIEETNKKLAESMRGFCE